MASKAKLSLRLERDDRNFYVLISCDVPHKATIHLSGSVPGRIVSGQGMFAAREVNLSKNDTTLAVLPINLLADGPQIEEAWQKNFSLSATAAGATAEVAQVKVKASDVPVRK